MSFWAAYTSDTSRSLSPIAFLTAAGPSDTHKAGPHEDKL